MAICIKYGTRGFRPMSESLPPGHRGQGRAIRCGGTTHLVLRLGIACQFVGMAIMRWY